LLAWPSMSMSEASTTRSRENASLMVLHTLARDRRESLEHRSSFAVRRAKAGYDEAA
jgi:hypothetical protein